jgi:hypothetical protein
MLNGVDIPVCCRLRTKDQAKPVRAIMMIITTSEIKPARLEARYFV